MALENAKKVLIEVLGMKNKEPCECGGEAVLVSVGASFDPVDQVRGPVFVWEYYCKDCGKTQKKSEKSKKTKR